MFVLEGSVNLFGRFAAVAVGFRPICSNTMLVLDRQYEPGKKVARRGRTGVAKETRGEEEEA